VRLFAYFSVGVTLAGSAWGQAAVEHAVITAGGSAAAAGAKGTGKSIGGVFRNLSETLDKAGNVERAENTRAAVAQSKQSAKPVPASKPVDPSQITEGLERAELINRFGEPFLKLS
jgi:hypothetical protein